jgi:hypothetical protein
MIILKKILMIGIMMTSKDDDNDSDSDDNNNDSDNSDDDNSDGDRYDDGYHKDESGQCERVVIIRQSKEVQTVTTGVRMANVKQQKIRLQD